MKSKNLHLPIDIKSITFKLKRKWIQNTFATKLNITK